MFEISYESSDRHTIYVKHQALFSLKNKKKKLLTISTVASFTGSFKGYQRNVDKIGNCK